MKIAYIDDKDFSSQVKKSIPSDLEYDFFYFSSYRQALKQDFDIIILDYYLDYDFVKSIDILDELSFKKCVGFSSISHKSKEIAEKSGSIYFCKKENSNNFNSELFSIITLIILELKN